MSSTEQKITEFFEQRLLPLAATGPEYFPRAPEPELSSYYRMRNPEAPVAPAPIDYHDRDTLAAALKAMWTEQGTPELVELADELADLAGALAEEQRGKEQEREVSPFVYVMF